MEVRDMKNTVTRPVDMVRLGNQKHGFSFQAMGNIYMLTDLYPIESEHCDVMQTVCMTDGEIQGFGADEYVEPVYTFTVHANPSLAKSERIVKDL
jgi:hypothetical protein